MKRKGLATAAKRKRSCFPDFGARIPRYSRTFPTLALSPPAKRQSQMGGLAKIGSPEIERRVPRRNAGTFRASRCGVSLSAQRTFFSNVNAHLELPSALPFFESR
jgi:hypothetical protein